jgi:O-antigen/teichoic acid export membrane protein
MPKQSNIGLIVKHAGADTIGTAFSIAVMFASSVVITRTIGADLFGKYSLSKGVFEILGVLAIFGLNTGMVKLTSKFNTRDEQSAVKGTLLSGTLISATLSVALTLLVIALAPFIASRAFPNVDGIALVLRVHIIALPFFALMTVFNGYTQGFKTLKYSVLTELVARPVSRLAAVVLLFLVGFRLFGVVFGTVFSFILAAGLALYFATKISPFHFRSTGTRLVTRELFFYSLPLVLARFTNIIIVRSNTILVGFFTDAASTGLFGAAVILSPFVSLSLGSFGKIIAPVISELWERKDLPEMEAAFKAATKWIFSLGFPVFLMFMLFSPALLLIFGEDFPRAATALRFLSVGQMVNAMVGPVGLVLSMTGRQKLNLVNSVVLAGVNIVLNIIMIPRYGIAGAGLATAISLGALNIVRVIQVKIIHGFTPFRQDLYKPSLAGAITFVVFYLLNRRLGWEDLTRTLLLCGAFAVVYIVLLLVFGVREEKEILFQILRRRK